MKKIIITTALFFLFQNLLFSQIEIYRDRNTAKIGLVDAKNTKITEPIYDDIKPISWRNKEYFQYKKEGDSGLLNAKGEEFFENEAFLPLEYKGNDIALYQEKDRVMFYNLALKKKINSVEYPESENVYIMFSKNKEYFKVMETDYEIKVNNGKITTADKDESIEFHDDYIPELPLQNSYKRKYIDDLEPIALDDTLVDKIHSADPFVSISKPIYYKEFKYRKRYLVAVILEKDNRYGLANNQGEILLYCQNKFIMAVSEDFENYAIVENAQGKYGLYNINEKKYEIEPKYVNIKFDKDFVVYSADYEGVYKDGILYLPN